MQKPEKNKQKHRAFEDQSYYKIAMQKKYRDFVFVGLDGFTTLRHRLNPFDS